MAGAVNHNRDETGFNGGHTPADGDRRTDGDILAPPHGDVTGSFPLAGDAIPSPGGAKDVRAPADLVGHPRYELLEFIGAGGMGSVYKAMHRLMDRVVALKVVNPQLVGRADMVERFRREVQTAARLNHPNIVTAYDADQAGRTHFFVMEFVDGVGLDRVLGHVGQLTVRQACDYARQAALGLQHAFERGTVHRDIKPHNLMLTPQGVVKILDFGLARYASETFLGGAALGESIHDAATEVIAVRHASDLTPAYFLVGTANYMAPEEGLDARTADIRADVYSLGCTLYHMLAGEVPFPEGNPEEKLRQHLRDRPRPLAALRGDLPAGLPELVERMMAKTPADRYQTPGEVARALAPFARATGRSVLVVEDEPDARESMGLALRLEGYDVQTAANGQEALEKLEAGPTPDLILLDLLMPGMNGWEFLERQRRDPALAAVPVVVISGADPRRASAAALGAIGVADYLPKPVDFDAMSEKLRRFTNAPGRN
jgi:serine/threonine protein kinase